MNRKNVYISETSEEIVLSFVSIPTYDDFDSILKYLKKYYDAKIIEILNGPDMRVSEMTISKIKFQLYNDPYGNELSSSIQGKDIIEKIAKDIDNRLQ